jgi:lysophospholipase L1-like esterase
VPTPIPPTTLRLAVLGDSIARGQGASHLDDTLAVRLARGLEQHGIDVQARVFAAPGASSADLHRQVVRALPWQPTVAVVVIGANDLTHQVPVERAAGLLGDAVRRLHEHGAEVVVAPAPDLSIVPHVPDGVRGVVRAASVYLRNRQVQAVRSAGGRVADEDGATSALFEQDRSLFSGDAFHPSSAGYEVIAAALLPSVLEAVAAAR